jgi:hypothetical protein
VHRIGHFDQAHGDTLRDSVPQRVLVVKSADSLPTSADVVASRITCLLLSIPNWWVGQVCFDTVSGAE